LGLLIVNRGQIEQEHLITEVAVVVVTLSLVVHSITAWPGIRWLVESSQEVAPDETPAQTPP
jgi:NhaP-type Na+/H+ or K+/H+ antiporter